MNKEYKPITNLWKDSEGYRYFGTLKLSSKIKYDGDDFIPLWEWANQLQQESQSLKKQLEEKENIACNWKDSCLENAGKIEILENQQKEFIKYLENEKDRLARIRNNICEDKFDEVNDILQKYKEIIGGKE